jgi:thiamine biosynthesis lipoprotein
MEFRRVELRAMGSPCALHLYAEGPERLEALVAHCRAEIERLEAKYSRYRDDSLVSRVNASAGDPAGIEVDDETAALLDYADTAHRQSRGLFDITSGALRRAWDFRSGRLPARETVDALRARVGWQRVRWQRPRFVLPTQGMEIDFGGVVKEYAADRIAELCRERGARHGLIDLGGDLAVVGPHPDGRPWRVGIRDPRERSRPLTSVAVYAGGVATSGDYERCMVIDGVTYGHLLDPRTGWPVRGPISVTVLAPHCLIAGTTSTVAMLSGEAGARAWLDAVGLPNVRVDRSGRVHADWELNRSGTPPRRPAPRDRSSAASTG